MVTPVEQFLPQLGRVLGVRREVPRKELREFYDKGDYQSIINAVKRGMGLEMNLRLARVYRGGSPSTQRASAWVMLPQYMPPFGSKEFRAMTITMYIRHSYMEQATFEDFVSTIAHELSHIVLDSIGHVWKRHEPAVDLAAMLLGYAEYYEYLTKGWYHPVYFASPFARPWKRYLAQWISSFLPLYYKRCWSYLSHEEIIAAARWIRINRR